jgi:hypothetical protein
MKKVSKDILLFLAYFPCENTMFCVSIQLRPSGLIFTKLGLNVMLSEARFYFIFFCKNVADVKKLQSGSESHTAASTLTEHS